MERWHYVALLVLALAGCGGGNMPETDESNRADVFPGARLEKCGLVLHRGAWGTWDAGMVESPVVWYDTTRGRYGMVYAGYAWATPERVAYEVVHTPQVGLAWSDDLVRWEKDPASPIFGPSDEAGAPDAAGTTGPFLWHEGGTYYLFYIGTTGEGYEKGRKTLNLATSPDLYRWTRHPDNPVIAPAGDGWRRDAIWHPHIVKVEGTYYLFFNASGVVESHDEERIGYATSTDLFHWKVDDTTAPILTGSGRVDAWDATQRAGDPSLFRVGDAWYMAYYSWDGIHAQDGLARTTAAAFPLGWQPYARNPVLRVGAPGSFDAQHAHKPFIVRTPSEHYHYYTAVDSSEQREIALAVWPGPCTAPR